jgi:hypothetical protein
MKTLTLRVVAALLFVSGANPAAAQATAGVPSANSAQVLVANGTLSSVLCHRDLQCPVMYRFLRHDHISAPAAINTGDESISLPLLNFIRAR